MFILMAPTQVNGQNFELAEDLNTANQVTLKSLGVTSRNMRDIRAYIQTLQAPPLDGGAEVVGSVVELDGVLTFDRKQELLSSGINIEEHLGGSLYLVSYRNSGDLDAMSLSLENNARSAAVLELPERVTRFARDPWIQKQKLEDEQEVQEPTYAVEFYSIVDREQALQTLENAGVKVVTELSDVAFAVLREGASPDTLADIPGVKVVDDGPMPFLPLNDTGRRVSESDQVLLFDFDGTGPIYDGHSGDDVRVGIADSGVDQGHNDFNAVQADGSLGATRVYNPRIGSGSHGTHVASIATGSGFNSNANGLGDLAARGHAPTAMVGDYGSMGTTVSRYHAAIVTDGSDVTNHSYVQSQNGYGVAAATIDRIVRGDATYDGDSIPARPQVWAAGNNGLGAQYGDEEGYYAVFTSAKNTISVGSVDTLDLRVSDFSSLGPTFDGRIKPDLVAPGCNDSLVSPSVGIIAANNNGQAYTGKCGTSMAAPVVTGIIAQLMDAYEDHYGVEPSIRPSTYKSVLIQTARDMVKQSDFSDREFDNPDTDAPIRYYKGPDFATGFGLVDAHGAVELLRNSVKWREGVVASTGETDTYCVAVPAGASEFKATIAWDDEPGSTVTSSTTAKLVNDLDLELVSPSGKLVRPWTLDPLPFTSNPGDGAQDPITNADVVPARRDVDRLNNVELASVPEPEAGRWFVKVRGFQIPNANTQAYSLASSHPIWSFCPTRPSVGQIDICKQFPKLCRIRLKQPVLPGPDWTQPVPLPELCKYVLNCPGCKDVGDNGLCPNWKMSFGGLPQGAKIIVSDEKGNVINQSSRVNAVKITDIRPGESRYVSIVDRNGRPYRKARPKIRVSESR